MLHAPQYLNVLHVGLSCTLFLSPQSHSFIQEKVFVGLEGASNQFNLADRLKGPDNSYLSHISAQTGGKAFLRGRGSGFIEPTSGKESFEALHIFIR